MENSLHSLMAGKSLIKLSGADDWEVTGKYLGLTKFGGITWINIDTGNKVYSYNLNHILAVTNG